MFLGTDWSLVPSSVIVGLLKAVDDSSVTLSGHVRLVLSPGVKLPDGAKIGTSVVVTVASKGGVLYAQKIEPTPDLRPSLLPPGR